jgi:phage terminase large subunit GpA-like protein
MDAMSDPTVHTVVVPKAHQVGYTEMLGNMLGFHIHQFPSPILVIQPTERMAEAWSQERLDAMLRDTPVLRDAVADPRSRDSGNTILRKRFTGGYLAIIGANSPASLASRPIRIVIADETDKYPASAEDKGDPLTLARHRQTNFWDAKTLLGSTPGHKASSVIWREWLKSDMREFFVTCPHCAHEQVMAWQGVRWDKAEDGSHLPESARYLCEECGSLWSDGERWRAVSKGKWVATAPFNGIAGFHITGFMSPWVKLEKIVREFLDAKDNPALLQAWVNETLGQPWEEEGESVDRHALMGRLEGGWGKDVHDLAPDRVLKVTVGVDVQANRFEVERVGWGEGEESWSLDFKVVYGDPNGDAIWREFDEYRLTPTRTVDGRTLPVSATCVDSGGHNTQAVYAQCNTPARMRAKVWAIKGADRPGQRIWPVRASRTKRGQNFFVVSVDPAKDSIFARLRIRDPGPGYCHFPEGRDVTYFEQLTAERAVTKWVRGFPKRQYEKQGGARNEALDIRVYAYAALLSLGVSWDRELKRAANAPRAPVAAVPESKAPTPPLPAEAVPASFVAQAQAVEQATRKRMFTRRTSRSSFMR